MKQKIPRANLGIAFIVGLFATIVLLSPLVRVAGKSQLLDVPNDRNVHAVQVPRVGGIAIGLGVHGQLRIVLEPAIIGPINPLVLKELKNKAKLQAHDLAIKQTSPSRSPAGKPKNKNVLAWAQTILKEDSLYKGKIDGIYGPKTRAAIESFQTQHGLDRTGKIDPLTLSKLKEARAE